jgi:predicted nucleotidyltransferase
VTGVAVRVAALQDIVESKRFAGRDKDREALPELERLLEQGD